MRPTAVFLLAMAAPVAAQDLVFSPDATAACVAGAEHFDAKRACISLSANQCMEDTEGGSSTIGMSGCLDQELTYWDQRLNAAYAQVVEEAKQFDQEMQEYGSHLAIQAETLRDMQRAWITFRDATCEYERSQWGGGTGGGPAMVGCLMSMTGEQALYLESARLGG